MSSVSGLAIYRAAKAREKTAFRHLGRDETGLDCIGLGIVACREAGILAPDFDVRNYSRTPNGHGFIRELAKAGLRRAPAAIRDKPGIIMTCRYGREPMHLAIIGPNQTMVHADSRAGKVVVHALNAAWQQRITAYWHFPEVLY